VVVLRPELGTGAGGAAIRARKKLAQVVHAMREDEASVMAWLEVARQRQRRAAELRGGGGENREEGKRFTVNSSYL
jgi:hypothetical protein